jgi:hypothetical protein
MDRRSIKVDLDVYKAIEMRRENISEDHNDILRRILELPDISEKWKGHVKEGLSCSSGFIPEGTKLRAKYKGKYYYAEVKGSAIVYNGERFTSPSMAASRVVGKQRNGWTFWEYLNEDAKMWITIDALRKKA